MIEKRILIPGAQELERVALFDRVHQLAQQIIPDYRAKRLEVYRIPAFALAAIENQNLSPTKKQICGLYFTLPLAPYPNTHINLRPFAGSISQCQYIIILRHKGVWPMAVFGVHRARNFFIDQRGSDLILAGPIFRVLSQHLQ